MVFVACGINHKTAPINVREKIAISDAEQRTILQRLLNLPEVQEATILSTCNRTEIYCETQQPDIIIPWLAKTHQLPEQALEAISYTHHGHEGIKHTLRVASGLDSMMLGEPQILGQMKQAYHQACTHGAVKEHLRNIFEYIFQASKRIRLHSGIGKNPVSIAFAAVQLIQNYFPKNKALRVFLIGSGETATLVAKYLHQQNITEFKVASRIKENAHTLAAQFNGQALSIAEIPMHLATADVIISATSCPLPFITETLVKTALIDRQNAPMFFLDLAVPRDIEASVGTLQHVQLYNIDDLNTLIDHGMNERRTAAEEAEQLIDMELEQFIRNHRAYRARDLICHYREAMQQQTQHELNRALHKIKQGQCLELVMAEFGQRLLNKLTHQTSKGLHQAALDNRIDVLDVARYFFKNNIEAVHEKIT